MALLEDLRFLIKPSILPNDKKKKLSSPYKTNSKPRLSFFIFENLQDENNEDYRKLIKHLDNFLSFYFKLKFDIEDYLIKSGWLYLQMFDLKVCNIKTCKAQDDTALIIGQIMMDAISQNQNLSQFITNTVSINLF